MFRFLTAGESHWQFLSTIIEVLTSGIKIYINKIIISLLFK